MQRATDRDVQSNSTLLQKAFALGLFGFLINKVFGSPFDDTIIFTGVILVVLIGGIYFYVLKLQGAAKRSMASEFKSRFENRLE